MKDDKQSKIVTGRFSQAILRGARKRAWQIWRMAEEARFECETTEYPEITQLYAAIGKDGGDEDLYEALNDLVTSINDFVNIADASELEALLHELVHVRSGELTHTEVENVCRQYREAQRGKER